MPATFRCYQLKRSKDARKRCINLMSPKYSVIVAENKGFSSRNYLGLFCHFLPSLQASSVNSDSANWPGYEAGKSYGVQPHLKSLELSDLGFELLMQISSLHIECAAS